MATWLLGTPYDDRLCAEAGQRLLDPFNIIPDRAWEIAGYDGNDLLVGYRGDDLLDAGNGNDTLLGEAGNDKLTAGQGNDQLYGGSGADTLLGDEGNDLLLGGSGNDILRGGSGRDTLIGGSGRDVLSGGTEADLFRWTSIADSRPDTARDVVTDFLRGSDRLDLAQIDANTQVSGNQAFAMIGSAEFSGTAGQLRSEIFTRADGTGVTLVQADLNGDRVADFEIQLTNTYTLTASDFIL